MPENLLSEKLSKVYDSSLFVLVRTAKILDHLDRSSEIQLATLAPLHVQLEPYEPVAADLLLAILQAAVRLRPDVRQVDRLPLQVGHQVPHLEIQSVSKPFAIDRDDDDYLALHQPHPLQLVLLALAGGLEHDEVPVLGEEIRRLEKFDPGCLEDVICFQE